jgi:hypothetical protein
MRLRARQRSLVVSGLSVGTAGGYGAPRLTATRRIRRFIRIGVLLSLIGLMRVARSVRPRWRPLLAGVVLTTVGVVLRNGVWGVVLLAGLWFFLYALLIPASAEADRRWREEMKRQLAGYSTPAQRRDLEATLDRYPDGSTYELRDILASQALAACNNGIPGAGR